jgi:hypothetical protein
MIDVMAEVPFQKTAPVGFYDTSKELELVSASVHSPPRTLFLAQASTLLVAQASCYTTHLKQVVSPQSTFHSPQSNSPQSTVQYSSMHQYNSTTVQHYHRTKAVQSPLLYA